MTGSSIERLVEELQRNHLVGGEEILDYLWCSRWIGLADAFPGLTRDLPITKSPESQPPPDSPPPPEIPGIPPPPKGNPSRASEPTDVEEEVPETELFEGGGVRNPVNEGLHVRQITLPGARPFRNSEALARALRPLRMGVDQFTDELDEDLTIERWLESGILLPHFQTRKASPFRITVVQEATGSARFWSAWVEDWLDLLRKGTRSPVEQLFLYPPDSADGRTEWKLARLERARPKLGVRNLSAPSPRRLVLWITDFASPYWRSGHHFQLAARWARRHPVSLLTPLSRDLQRRTVLKSFDESFAHCQQLGRSRWFDRDSQGKRRPMFLLRFDPAAIENWARVVTGHAATGHLAVAWDGQLHPPALRAEGPLATLSSAEIDSLVDKVRRNITPSAFLLAQTLAAAPLTTGIMRLVQRALYPWMNHEVLAEVLFSGLIYRRPHQADVDADKIQYEFRNGDAAAGEHALRDELFNGPGNSFDKAEQVQRVVGDYLAQHFGPNPFGIDIIGPAAQGDGAALTQELIPLARVLSHVWQQFDGERAKEGIKLRRILNGEAVEEEESTPRRPRISDEVEPPDETMGALPNDDRPPTLINSIGMTMLGIPSGTFTMGSPADEPGRDADEFPQHEVTLSEPFRIARTPVTQKQWRDVMGTTVEEQKAKGSAYGEVTATGDDHPVYFVNPEDTLRFCDTLTVRDRAAGLIGEDEAYALPTEAQWEYACRAGTKGPYNVNSSALADVGWFRHNSGNSTQPVGEKLPNAWGLHDCHGNVWEWCADWFERSTSTGPTTDPQGPPSGGYRVLRGGSWSNDAQKSHSARRYWYAPGLRYNHFGFRPVLSPVKQREAQGVLPPKPEAMAQPEPEVQDEAARSVRPHFVPIKAGTFLMGSPETEKGRSDDEHRHQVTLTQDFEIADAPITKAQYNAVTGSNPSDSIESGSAAPVEQVSWDEAVEWCDRMNKRDSGYDYRLPTEAEWEYACRAGSTGAFNVAEAQLDELAWYLGNSDLRTHRVKQKLPNAWGLYDCHGNVWEWCEDWYGAYPDGHVTDPTGPRVGVGRVLRGGCFGGDDVDCRNAVRTEDHPGVGQTYAGFRPVRTKKKVNDTAPEAEPTKAVVAKPESVEIRPMFVPIPPGVFLMGSPPSENARSTDENQHAVNLTRVFEIADAPVTQAQYESVIGANPSHFKESGPDAPVEQVSWEDAMDWCQKMSAQDADYDYRLPTEAEWEYSCRAGTTSPYHFGSKLNGSEANCDGTHPYGTTEKGSYLKHTSKVRSYPPNAWRLYDLHGNVWEWCADWYGEYSDKAVADPRGADKGDFRVLRGGSWDDGAQFCRSGNRHGCAPDLRLSAIGFRPVRMKKAVGTELEAVTQPEPAHTIARSSAWIARDFTVPASPGMKMLCIGAGEFLMGEGEEGHPVTLTEDFFIAENPVTQAQYEAVMGSNPSRFKEAGADAPVEQVSWDEALAFCAKLNQIAEPEDGWEWALPTEAQWEYACRAGRTTAFTFGDVLNGTQANCDGNHPYGTEEKGPYLERTSPVRSYPANPWGLYDCHGNVWEWCADWHGEYPKQAVVDPQGPESGAHRVLRGGSWRSNARLCRSSSRDGDDPANRGINIGFRPVLTRKKQAEGTEPEPEPTQEAEVKPVARSRPEDYVAADFENGLGMEMVCVPPGMFTMGSPVGEEVRKSKSWIGKETLHHVTLTERFWIAKTPMTQGAWHTLMGTTVAEQRAKGKSNGEVTGTGNDHPVYFVTWEEALAACDRLSTQERDAKRLPDGYLYTLPTEAQWEYACRAGTEGSLNVDDASLQDLGWYAENSVGSTHPVAKKAPNAWGLHDCHGNVWEWCADWYRANLGSDDATDSTVATHGEERTLRGGSWVSVLENCYSYSRSAPLHGQRDRNIGFRPVLAPRKQRTDLAVLPAELEAVASGTGSRSATADASTAAGPIRPVFVPIPAGSFMMGSPRNETGRFDDETQHEVMLSRPFYIADAPVTQAQYEAIMKTNPSKFKESGPEAPVEQVSWENAVEWCRRMSEQDPVHIYRLPTEAEWEYACRARTTGPYNLEGESLDKLAWHSGNAGSRTHPIRGKSPNGWGLYDCHGNVLEWCADWYKKDLGIESVNDPKGPPTGSDRVLRGGSWDYNARSCRSADRGRFPPDERSILIGFRPVRTRRISDNTVPEPGPTQEAEVKAQAQSPRRGWFGGLFGGKR